MKIKNRNFYFDIMADNDGITGSCMLLSIHYPYQDSPRRILVDCGMNQGEDRIFGEEYERNAKFYFKPEGIECVLITHPHADHIGRLPLLANKGYSRKIHLVSNAAKVMRASLYNNFQITKRKAKMLKREPSFVREDVDKVMDLLETHNYRESIDLGNGLKVTFFENGHLSGAALILLQASCEGYDDINLLFTGDYKSENDFFEVPDLPDLVKDLPLSVVIESTYGNENSFDPGNEQVFERNLLQAIKEKKEFIIPVCALERAQIILYKLKRLQVKGKLSTEVPILVDGGLTIQHTMTYQNQLELSPDVSHNILPENVTFIQRKKRHEYLSSYSPKIVIASGGMGSFGAAQIWISSRLSRKDAVIHFTCYLAKGTLGRAIYDTVDEGEVKFARMIIKKSATTYYTGEFSAHAKSDKLINFLKQFKKLKLVIINHGEPETKEIFLLKVRKEVNPNSATILDSTVFHRIDSNGLVKSMSTKF